MMIATLLAWGMPGGGELIIILLIVLVLFGAKRLPELARSLGQAKNEFSKATREAAEEFEKTKDSPPKKEVNGTYPKDENRKA